MAELLSPKQVAKAFDVSESSVKRWCDKGVIPTHYTNGGHRRIDRSDVVALVRAGKQSLVHPEALGLPAVTVGSALSVTGAAQQLLDALLAGDELRCRQTTIELYFAEHSLSAICDQALATAFHGLGEQWSCGEAEVYQERRGCEIALRILRELRSLMPRPAEDAPIAIGGTISGDHYSLATSMAELVLTDCGWNAISLGSNLPFDTLGAAIRDQRPHLFWLSCSFVSDPQQFVHDYRRLHDEFSGQTAFCLGGAALTEPIRERIQYSSFCDRMRHLESFATTLGNAIKPSS